MGTDIHVAIEGRVGIKWAFLGWGVSHRNYGEFGILTGTRGSAPGKFAKYHTHGDCLADLSDASQEVRVWLTEAGEYGHGFWVANRKQFEGLVKKQMKLLTAEFRRERNLSQSVALLEAKKHMDVNSNMLHWIRSVDDALKIGLIDDARVIAWYDN